MKILLVTNMFPSFERPHQGVFVKNTCDVLLGGGYDVDVVTLSHSNGLVTKILNYIAFYFSVICRILNGRHDYLYVHFVSHCCIPVWLCSFIVDKKIISHVHGGDIKFQSGRSLFFFRIKFFLSKLLLSKSNKVIVPSKYFKDYICSELKVVPDENIIVYPSGGIDSSIFHLRNSPIKTISKFGFAGRLEITKRVDFVIDIFEKLVSETPGIHLYIVGEGSQEQSLKSKVKLLNLGGSVTFLGPKSQHDLANWYRSIDLLVYPSETESLGLVPLEAMSCGTVTVVSDIPAFREYMPGGNGYICSSLPEFVSTIREISSMDEYQLSLLSTTSAKYVLDNYSSNVVSGVLIDAFR